MPLHLWYTWECHEDLTGPHSSTRNTASFWFIWSGMEPRICISIHLPSDVDLANPCTMLTKTGLNKETSKTVWKHLQDLSSGCFPSGMWYDWRPEDWKLPYSHSAKENERFLLIVKHKLFCKTWCDHHRSHTSLWANNNCKGIELSAWLKPLILPQ